jgi:hypothetical protein
MRRHPLSEVAAFVLTAFRKTDYVESVGTPEPTSLSEIGVATRKLQPIRKGIRIHAVSRRCRAGRQQSVTGHEEDG